MSKSSKLFVVQLQNVSPQWLAGPNLETCLTIDVLKPQPNPVLLFQPNSGGQSWSFAWVGGGPRVNISNGCYNIYVVYPSGAAAFNIASDPQKPQFVVKFDSSGHLPYHTILELTPTQVNVRKGSC